MATKEELLETAKVVKSHLIVRGGRYCFVDGRCRRCPASMINNADGKRCGEAGRDNIEFFTKYIEQNEEKGMKTQIEKLKKDLAELEAQYEKEQKEAENKCKLLLAVDTDNKLCIMYKGNSIGRINSIGEMYILNTDSRVELYEEWRAAGMPFSEETVIWRGGVYTLCLHGSKVMLQRVGNICSTLIYDVTNCNAVGGCEDTNIIRFKHNNKPRLF